MDLAHLEQIVNWLDEEHRRNRNEIVRLSHLVETQSADLVDQHKHIQELEASLARSGQYEQRIQQLEEELDQVRQESVSLLEREGEQRQRVQREQDRARVGERDAWRREISNLQRDLSRISQVEQSLLLREEDLKRLQEVLQSLTVQIENVKTAIEERTEHVPFLMESRGTERKRLLQLQEDQTDLMRRIEELGQELSRYEADGRKNRTEFGALHAARDKQQKDLESWREELRVEVQDVRHRISGIVDAAGETPAQIEQVRTQVNALLPFQNSAQNALSEVRALNSRLEQGLQQIREENRVFQTKQEKVISDAQSELQERERKGRMRMDHLEQAQDRLEIRQGEHLQALQQNLRLHESMIQQLWSLQEAYPEFALRSAQEHADSLRHALQERDRLVRSIEEEWNKLRRDRELFADNGQNPAQSS